MHIERGSTWNKWDFHVHTPYSILNNQYGFDPDPNYKTDVAQFDEYVKILFSKAIEKEIVAIGITDYFSVDGYKRIRLEYLDKPEKMTDLFPDDEMRERIEQIYVFPNIEFRIPTFIGKKASPVNYHVIFSDCVPVQEIEREFLLQLKLKQDMGTDLPLCRENIERIGADYRKNNPATGSDYHIGLEHITIDENKILEVLKNEVFKDKYFISIPVDDSLSSAVTWQGRDSIPRKLLYQQSNLLMTSNDHTVIRQINRCLIRHFIFDFSRMCAQ